MPRRRVTNDRRSAEAAVETFAAVATGSMTAGRDTRCPARGTDSRSALKTGLSATRLPNQPSTSCSGEWLLCSAHQTDDASLNALETLCEVCQSNNSYS